MYLLLCSRPRGNWIDKKKNHHCQARLVVVEIPIAQLQRDKAVPFSLPLVSRKKQHPMLRIASVRHVLLFVSGWALSALDVAQAQRFLREGFSNQMESDFRGEMKLDENEALSGMTREMFLIQDLEWELEPPMIKANLDGKLQRHMRKYLDAPIQLKLLKNKGKYGLRAVGVLPNGQKLRGFWRQGSPSQMQLKASDFLEASYDDAVRSRLFVVDFEIQLPPLGKGKGLPSVVYQVAVEPGSMNPKAYIPRGSGRILVYPSGHEQSSCVDAGTCNVGVSMRAGLVDPTWARGRPFFRKGRSPGLI
jgi:hypothetical protein